MTRGIIRILLPAAFVFAIVFVTQGMIQSFDGNTTVTTVEGKSQVIQGGPVASQESIKELGTNGGGSRNANSAHPFENPNGFTDFAEIYLLLVIPFSLAWTFGKMAGNKKQGIAVLMAMLAIWLAASVGAMLFETGGNSALDAVKVNQQTTSSQSGGNMEGKETRFGAAGCGLYASSTTGTSTGAVNCAHDSMTPLGGGVALVNIMLGEVSPGGVGAGLYGMLIFALLSVFIAGLMVGRTPEYLGKKIQAAEMKLVVIYLLAVPLVILVFAGASVVMKTPQASIFNPGAHGLSEVVYGFTSTSNNNGSAFGGLGGNTDWYNTTFSALHADRALHPDRRRARGRGIARPQADGARVLGHVPHRHAAVHRTARLGGRGRRRPHVPARPCARPHRRAPRALRRREEWLVPPHPPARCSSRRSCVARWSTACASSTRAT